MTLDRIFRPVTAATGKNPPRLLLVTDATRLPDPRAAMNRLPRGAGVLIRHRDDRTRALMATHAAVVAKRRRLAMLVSEDWRLAARLAGAGLHLPEMSGRHGCLAPALGWARRRGVMVTMACHGRAALARAKQLRLSAALLSPVFATASHPGAAGLGVLRVRQWTRRAGLPILALGGLTAVTARGLAHSGAWGGAAISGLS